MIKVCYLHPAATFARHLPGDVGYDLTCCGLHRDKTLLWRANLGVTVEPPPGHFFLLTPRSSLAIKGWQLANGVGVIDEGYRGEWIALLHQRHKLTPVEKLLNTRIVQAILLPRLVDQVVEARPEASSRGERGFGSTDHLEGAVYGTKQKT